MNDGRFEKLLKEFIENAKKVNVRVLEIAYIEQMGDKANEGNN